MEIDWGNPSERAALIERIGLDAYNKAFKEHQKNTTVKTVGGHAIQTVKTQFGKLYAVGGTNMAFKTLKEAEEYASKHSVDVKDSNTDKPRVKLVGENGNVFNLMNICSSALKDAGQPGKAKEMCNKIQTTAKSYEEALAIMMDYCEVE